MKPLELTKEHKEKLLEMCKALFPEYKYFRLHDGTCDLCTEGALDIHEDEKPRWNRWYRFNWFEFCMTCLIDKIWELIPKHPKDHIYKGLGINPHVSLKEYLITTALKETHPIDYLYEQFKKLK